MRLVSVVRSVFSLLAGSMVLAGSIILSPQSASASCGLTGLGTADSPYLIMSATDLAQIETCGLGASYRLTQDIGPVTAIAASSAPFTGIFDGAGYAVSLSIASNQSEIALFGQAACPAVFKNLELSGSVRSTSTSVNYAAPLLAFGQNLSCPSAERITVESVHAAVNIDYTGNGYGGGLVAFSTENVHVSRSSFIGSVRASGQFVEAGAIAGRLSGSITDSYAIAEITSGGDERLGGLVGYTGSVGVAITRAYSSSTVTVNSATNGGGVAGGQFGAITASSVFWNTEIGPPNAFDDGRVSGTSISNAIGKTSTQLRDISTYSSAGWTITDEWEPYVPGTNLWGICRGLNDGFPFLLSQYTEAEANAGSCPAAPPSQSTGAEPEKAAAPAIHLDVKAKVGDQISGTPAEIAGTGLGSGSTYSLVVRSTPTTLDSGSANGSGAFENTVRMPTLSAGTHSVTLTAVASNGSTLSLVQTFTVSSTGVITSISDPTGSVTRSLAATGANSQSAMWGFGIAMALIAAGVFVRAVRRSNALAV